MADVHSFPGTTTTTAKSVHPSTSYDLREYSTDGTATARDFVADFDFSFSGSKRSRVTAVKFRHFSKNSLGCNGPTTVRCHSSLSRAAVRLISARSVIVCVCVNKNNNILFTFLLPNPGHPHPVDKTALGFNVYRETRNRKHRFPLNYCYYLF